MGLQSAEDYVAAVLEEAGRDVVTAVKQHPRYAEFVAGLAGKAVQALAEASGVPL